MRITHFVLATFTVVLAACASSTAPGDSQAIGLSGRASGGTSGGTSGTTSTTDSIKVGKHFWVASNNTLLVSASSSDKSAHLYLYTGSGTFLGEVANGSNGQYGGSVFFSMTDPVTLTIKSSSGGSITFATVPYQP